MPVIDMSDPRRFNRRNLHEPSPGEVQVRPGLRRLYDWTYDAVGAKTVKSPTSGMTHHYVVRYDSSGGDVYVDRYDEGFNLWDTVSLAATRKPRVVTFAPVGQEMMIMSPDFAPVRAVIGGHLEIATIQASANSNTTAIPVIPWGIAVAWKNRVVIAGQPTQDTVSGLYFSDPFKPRTYVGQNFLGGPWASPVHGLHVSAGGALLVLTETGVWAVPDGVVGGGPTIEPAELGHITDLSVHDFGQTCQSRGEVWALTRRGLRRAYPPAPDEIAMAERRMPRAVSPRIDAADFRTQGRMVGSDLGPMVGYEGKMFWLDTAASVWGWWTWPGSIHDLAPVGILHEPTGEELIVTKDTVYRVHGNFDGDNGTTEESATTGYFSGTLSTDGRIEHRVSHIRAKAQGPGAVKVGINGEVLSKNIAQKGAVEAVQTWEDTTDLLEPTFQQVTKAPPRAEANAFEMSVEVGATYPGTRLHPFVEVAGKAGAGLRDKGN